jgi:NAD(P)-dependent dehydrogenase (short-subunit alcohol dehydrogenase family)
VTSETARTNGSARLGRERYRPNRPALQQPFHLGSPEGGNLQTNEETWERSWQVIADVRSVQRLLTRMMARGGGHFRQTISAAGLITSNSAAAYTVTKHAALGFAEWLRLYHGDRYIKVSCLCPTGGRDAARAVRWHGHRTGSNAGLDRRPHGARTRTRELPDPAESGDRWFVPQEGHRL